MPVHGPVLAEKIASRSIRHHAYHLAINLLVTRRSVTDFVVDFDVSEETGAGTAAHGWWKNSILSREDLH